MKTDRIIGGLFLGFTLAFIAIAMLSQPFFDWVFDRHHNQWSWYLRPIFLVPFCYAAYRQSLAGIGLSIFCLFTSMFWFSRPEVVDTQVVEFLQFEKEWLQSKWSLGKFFAVVSIPFSLSILALAFWKRSIPMGLGVVILIATGKVIWSIQNAGDSGKSIILPAIMGVAVCVGLIIWGTRNTRKNQ